MGVRLLQVGPCSLFDLSGPGEEFVGTSSQGLGFLFLGFASAVAGWSPVCLAWLGVLRLGLAPFIHSIVAH